MKKPKFIGLKTKYRAVDGQMRRRIHMDGAASPLAAKTMLTTIKKVLPHYSNTHSYVHSSAHISTEALSWAHSTVLDFVGADPKDYASIFIGSGSTAAINRVARGLSQSRSDKNIVIVSAMEHHANDLPHRQFGNDVIYCPLNGEGETQGEINLIELEKLLHKNKGRVNYIALSSVSNVTGIMNPLREIAKLAHRYGALLLVDGAQSVAHIPTLLSSKDSSSEIDFFVFSGHKLYTPTSPGVLIAKKAILDYLPGQDLGGGSVAEVSYYDHELLENYPDREQSGTTNIVGSIALAAVMRELKTYGENKIQRHNRRLIRSLYSSLSKNPDITIYGANECQRIGVIAFNHISIDHGLLAAILNDYFVIAVRNECFCAHPYVSSMLKERLWELELDDIPEAEQQAYINRKRGMVRISISLYNKQSDVDYLIAAIEKIASNIDQYRCCYTVMEDGSYQHIDYKLEWQEYLPLL